MSQRLIRPGFSASLAGKLHPRTGQLIQPVGVLPSGKVVWPVLGGAEDDDSDDPDDENFQDGGRPSSSGGSSEEDDEDEDESEEDDEEDSKKDKPKSKKDDEDEDDDEKPRYTQAEYDKLRRRMKAADKRASDTEARIRNLENKGRKPEEVQSEELTAARSDVERLQGQNRDLQLQLAFYRSNTVEWADPSDALRLLDLSEIEVDDDGTVNARELRAALKDLARRKPHLVKKSRASDTDDEDDDSDQRSTRRSGPAMNGKRKGSTGKSDEAARKAELAKKFPVLNRR